MRNAKRDKRSPVKKLLLVWLPALLVVVLAVFLLDYLTGYEIHRDVAYGEKEANVMDVFLPNGYKEGDRVGCVVMIHGGSWSGGDKREAGYKCRLLASRGYMAATVNYTLWSEETASEYTVSQVLDELDASILKLQEVAQAKGLILDKVATEGYSAGAHLALLYAYSRGETAPVEIAFAASMAGPAHIYPEAWGEEMTARVARRLTGVEITPEMLRAGEADGILDAISPTAYIDQAAPPTLLMQGGRDTVVPPANAEALADGLSKHGVPYRYIYLSRSDHGLWQNPLRHLTYYRALLQYCRAYFESYT